MNVEDYNFNILRYDIYLNIKYNIKFTNYIIVLSYNIHIVVYFINIFIYIYIYIYIYTYIIYFL